MAATSTWNTTNGTWSISEPPETSPWDVEYADGNDIVFGDVEQDSTVTMKGPLAPGSIEFNNTGKKYTIIGSGANGLDGATITGTTGIVKKGTGMLVLQMLYGLDFEGDVVVEEGTFRWGNGNAGTSQTRSLSLGSGNIIVKDGATFQFHFNNQKSSTEATPGIKVSVTNNLVLENGSKFKIEDGSTNLAGNLTIQGTATSQGAYSGCQFEVSGDLIGASDAVWDIKGSTEGYGRANKIWLTKEGGTSYAGTITVNGGTGHVDASTILVITDNNSLQKATVNLLGATDKAKAILTFGEGITNATLGGLDGNIGGRVEYTGTSASTLTFNNSATRTYRGSITGDNLSLVKKGNGNQRIYNDPAGTNTMSFNGGVIIEQGTLTFGSMDYAQDLSKTYTMSFGSGDIRVKNGATFSLHFNNRKNTDGNNANVTLLNKIVLEDGAKLNLSDGGATLAGELSILGKAAYNGSWGALSLVLEGELTGGPNAHLTFNGHGEGYGYARKNYIYLNHAGGNSYQGTITVNGATNTSDDGAGTASVLQLGDNNAAQYASINLVGKLGGNAQSGFSTLSIADNVNNAVVANISGNAKSSIQYNGSAPSTLTISNTRDNTFSGAINGSNLSIVKNGASTTLTLDGTLNFGGTLTVNEGIVALGNADTMTVGNTILGAGKIRKVGAGTVVITGNNSYQGGTEITAGRLVVGNGGESGTLGSGLVTLSNGASLVYNRLGTLNIDGITGTGNVTYQGGGIYTQTALNDYTGVTTISGGSTLQIDYADKAGGYAMLSPDSTMTLNGGILSLLAGDNDQSLTLAGLTLGENTASSILMDRTATGSANLLLDIASISGNGTLLVSFLGAESSFKTQAGLGSFDTSNITIFSNGMYWNTRYDSSTGYILTDTGLNLLQASGNQPGNTYQLTGSQNITANGQVIGNLLVGTADPSGTILDLEGNDFTVTDTITYNVVGTQSTITSSGGSLYAKNILSAVGQLTQNADVHVGEGGGLLQLDGTSWSVSSNKSLNIKGTASLSGSSINVDGTLNLANGATFEGGSINVNGSMNAVGNAGVTGTNITVGGQLNLSDDSSISDGAVAVSGLISLTENSTLNNTVLTLSGDSGSRSRLVFDSVANLGSSTLSAQGGIIELTTANSVGLMQWLGNSIASSTALVLNLAAEDATLSHTADIRLAGGQAVSLTKTGAGTLYIDSKITSTVDLVIDQGKIVMTKGSTGNGLLRGSVTIKGGTELSLAATDVMGWDGGATGLSRVKIEEGGKLTATVSGNQSWAESDFTLQGAGILLDQGSIAVLKNLTFNTKASNISSVIDAKEINLRITTGSGYNEATDRLMFNVERQTGKNDDFSDLIVKALIKDNNSSTHQTIVKQGEGTMTLTNDGNSFKGKLRVESGTLMVGQSSEGSTTGGTTGVISTNSNANVEILQNAKVVFNRSNEYNVVHTISGQGSVIQKGSGTTTLGNNSSYTGGTVIKAGTLVAAAENSLGDSSGSLHLQGGALKIDTANLNIGNVTMNGGAIYLGAALPDIARSGGASLLNGNDAVTPVTLTLASNADFTMTSGDIYFNFISGGEYDKIIGDGGSFTATGGILHLVNFNYESEEFSYQILEGFAPGLVDITNLQIVGYDTTNWAATIDNNGLLSFELTGNIPEPSSAALIGLGVLGLGLRRKRTK